MAVPNIQIAFIKRERSFVLESFTFKKCKSLLLRITNCLWLYSIILKVLDFQFYFLLVRWNCCKVPGCALLQQPFRVSFASRLRIFLYRFTFLWIFRNTIEVVSRIKHYKERSVFDVLYICAYYTHFGYFYIFDPHTIDVSCRR